MIHNVTKYDRLSPSVTSTGKSEIVEIDRDPGDPGHFGIRRNSGTPGNSVKNSKKHHRVIVAGSRNINDINIFQQAVHNSKFQFDEIVSGNCSGVDRMGEEYSRDLLGKEAKLFPASWKFFGKKAGPMRNEAMARYSTHLLLIWDGKSRGSRDMLQRARNHGLKIFETVIAQLRSPVASVAVAKSPYDVAKNRKV